MKFRRRRAPVSTLRARLSERVREREREKEGWEQWSEYDPGRPAEPFFLAGLLRRMHKYLLFKVAAAVVIVFLAALLCRSGWSWGRPVLDSLRFVTGWHLDLSTVSQAVPAFRATWESWQPGTDSGGAADRIALPLDGRLAGDFGLRGEEMHYGIDLAASEGAEVRVLLDGVVREVNTVDGVTAVLVDHGSAWQTLYRGLGAVEVKEGDTVTAGRLLGALGVSSLDESSHLHFELRWNGRPVPPPEEWVAQFRDPL